MKKTAGLIPRVKCETLTLEEMGRAITITVGTPAWYNWLEKATTFSFEYHGGSFTAHKAQAGNRRGGWYWRASRSQHNQTFRVYLGISANLTLATLCEASRRLNARMENRADGQRLPRPRATVSSSPTASTPMSFPILTTRCVLPRLPVQHVPRPRLVALIEKGSVGMVTLVSAPAGSGKTTLLVEWAHTTALPIAWLALEAGDNDPVRFLAYILTALSTLDERIGYTARNLLRTNAGVDHESVLTELVNDLEHYLTSDVALILDDYHVLESQAIHAALRFLLEHMPAHLHLILGTRIDPPLPLAGWRARGQLGEIRTDVLRFDIGEMQTFLQHMELDLPPAALSRLTERTEGWIAGIQLAALILRGHENHEEFLYGFRGNHRLLLEYIREEILHQQRPQVRAFLLQTSILTHLSGSLCTAVTGEAASRQLLEELRQANLFVSALDETGEEYRYHPLFAEGLRHQLRQQDPLLFQELSARAQAWYEAHEMFQEACEYALQARNFEQAISLLERQAGKLLGNGAFAILGRWLAQLPAEKIAQSPLLLVVASWTNWVLLEENDQARQGKQATARLQQRLQEPVDEADRATQTEARVNLSAMLVLQALDEHNGALALQRAQHMLQELPEEVTYLRSLALLCLHLARGVGHFLNGDFVAAEHILIEALHHLQATNYHFLNLVALANLMEIYEAQGELQKSAHLHQRMLRLLRSHMETPPEFFIGVRPEYVNLLLEWNRLDEAEMELKQIQTQSRNLQIAETHRLILILEANLLQLRLYRARGRYQEAMELLLSTEEELAKLPPSHPLSDSVAQGRVRLLLGMGKDVEATLWLNSCDVHYDDICQTPPARELFARYMTLARVLIAQGRRFPRAEYLGQALALLEHLYEVYERAGLTGRVIEILALLSLALQAQGETRAAFARLVHAVSLAETAGFVRLFIDEGEPMLRLLARLPIQKLSTRAYLQVLLDAAHPAEASQYHNRHSPAHPLLLEPLSAREQEVLGLLATGAANQEIAARLVISPNTAKRHVKHILAKLAVTNRTQAVTRAHELHLL